MTSPKDSDHFEVTRPLLFWTSTPAAKKYEVYIDNAQVGDVAASPLPAVDYRWRNPCRWGSIIGQPCVADTNYSKSQPDNIVLFIAGTLNGKGKWYYAISEMLFSKADLTKKVAILDDCIMKPQEPYESGQYKNCIWMNCIISHEGQWMMYYGAGDRNVALATAPVK